MESTGTPREARPAGGGGRRWSRRLLLTLAGMGFALGVLAVALAESGPGQGLVLGMILKQVRAGLAGTLVVDDIRSPTLLRGATLRGVRLEAEGGRRFLEADSVHMRYSVLSLLGARPRLASLTLFRPRVEISTYPGEDGPNVRRLLAPRPEADSARTTGRVNLGRVRIHEGLLVVLTPLEGQVGPRVPTVPTPDGSARLRRLGLEGIDLELRDVTLSSGAPEVLAARLAALSTDVEVFDTPLVVTGAEGRVRFGDAGLRLDSAGFRFPESSFEGSLALGPRPEAGEGWSFRIDLGTVGPASLGDLAWLDPRAPDGVFRGGLGVSVGGGVDVDLRDVRVDLESSQLSLDGGVRVSEGLALRDLTVQASPLLLSRLQPWLSATLPLEGWLSGNARLSGRPAAMAADGRITFVPVGYGGRPSTADFDGTLHMGSDPGVTSFHATVDPLNPQLLAALRPALGVPGRARVRVDASGRVDEGMRFTADVSHAADTTAVTRLLTGGSVFRSEDGRWITDVQGDLSPLSLGLLSGLAPGLALRGSVSGPARAVGPLDALRVTGDLSAGAGTVELDGTFNLVSPASGYRVDARLDGVELSHLSARVPEPSLWSGRIVVDGAGLDASSLDARGLVSAVDSRIGGLHVDTVSAAMAAVGGVLTVDTLDARAGGIHVFGSGEVGLVAGVGGSARLAFSTPSLVGLRPLLYGDSVLARDELSPSDELWLRLEGTDVDTLPLAADIAMRGELEGTVDLVGSLDSLDLSGRVVIRDAALGRDRVALVEAEIQGAHVTALERVVGVTLVANDLEWAGRSFRGLEGDVSLRGRSGAGTLAIQRSERERYDLAGAFVMDTLGGGRVSLDRATLDIDGLPWRLARPAEAEWDSNGVSLRDVELGRPDDTAVTVTAEGRLAWQGSSDLRVEARGLQLDRVGRVAQWPDSLSGRLDLELSVNGPAGDPSIVGTFDVLEPRYARMRLTGLSGHLGYAGQVATVGMEAFDGTRKVFEVGGTVPVDLSLAAVESRTVPRPMDLRVAADSLDAAVALSYVGLLEDVEGRVSGEFRVRGTVERPEPSGEVRLENGAWSIDAVGVRHREVDGTLTLTPDRIVQVTLSTQAAGRSTVEGHLELDPVTNPTLDLTFSFVDFEAVNRRDVAGHISGETRLRGRYREPVLEGSLTVDHGTLFLEEFARSARVVDLTDPRIFDLVVDTSIFATRPLLAGINNPFLQNLRVGIDLSVPRATWLRSQDMNVEIGGSLLVSYDRMGRDLVMVGELQALRGSYLVLGRRFEVREGVVGFIGTPGINPTLDIEAVSRVRRVDSDPLEVTATVSGTLTQPRVTLSSEEQGVAESDLVSYLIFGRPSYELASGQDAFVQGAAGSLVATTAGAGVTYFTGTLANQLGAAVAQQIGVDYLSITQAGDFGVVTGSLANSLAGTQIEIGQYLGENVFFVLLFRPRPEGSQDYFAGARVEVALTEDYNVQGFWEDRFLRGRGGAFGDLPFLGPTQVVGVFIFREWGY